MLSIRDVLPATPRARIVRVGLDDGPLSFAAGQAVLVGNHGGDTRKPYSIANAPEDAAHDGWIERLIGLDGEGSAGSHLTLERGASVDVEGPYGSFTFPVEPIE